MPTPVVNDGTRWSGRQEGGASRKPLPQRLARLSRKNSLVVKVRCTTTFKAALKDAAKRVKRGSVNRLVRKAFHSRRYHFPNLPSPQPVEKATARITLRLTADEWQAFKEYAAAWRIPLCRALWLLVARPYTVADRPRTLSHTHNSQRGAQFANSSWNFYAKSAKGCGPGLSHTSHKKEEKKKKEYLNECTLRGDEIKPINGLAEKLWRTYGVKVSVANDLTARYDKEAIEAAMELRERRNGAIYNPAGFIIYLLRKGCAQRWAEIKRARQDPDFLASQVKEAVEASGFPVTVVISECIPFAELPNARLALPLDPERAVSILHRIFHPERAEMTEFGEPDEPTPSNPLGRADIEFPSLHYFPTECFDAAETTTETFQTTNSNAPDGDTAFAPAAQHPANNEEETEYADRCRQCGKHNSEIPICDDTGLCLECAGFTTLRICNDCGGEFEVAYRERYDTLLCRRCYLKRLARSAGIADYEPPPRFPWIEFPEQEEDEEKHSQDFPEAQEDESQQARKTPLEWLKSLFLGR